MCTADALAFIIVLSGHDCKTLPGFGVGSRTELSRVGGCRAPLSIAIKRMYLQDLEAVRSPDCVW